MKTTVTETYFFVLNDRPVGNLAIELSQSTRGDPTENVAIAIGEDDFEKLKTVAGCLRSESPQRNKLNTFITLL